MIGQLRGKLIEKQPPFLMLDVGGVGYIVQAPLSTFFELPALGEDVVIRTHQVVREDAQLLYGFSSKEECSLFQEIIKISGVGPKIALVILSGLSPQAFMDVISAQDLSRLQRLPGIGAKTAQRILVELQDKLPKMHLSLSMGMKLENARQNKSDPLEEAVAALITLGYKPQEASKAVNKVKHQELSCEQIIKEALQGLAKV